MFYKAASGDAELISFTNPANQKQIPSVLVSTLPHKTRLGFWEFRLHNVIHTDGVQPKKDVAKHADIKLYRTSQQRYDSVTVKVRWARGWVKTFSRLKGLERSSLGWIPGREGVGRGCQTTAKHTHIHTQKYTQKPAGFQQSGWIASPHRPSLLLLEQWRGKPFKDPSSQTCTHSHRGHKGVGWDWGWGVESRLHKK